VELVASSDTLLGPNIRERKVEKKRESDSIHGNAIGCRLHRLHVGLS
jgi:hypothetical protein